MQSELSERSDIIAGDRRGATQMPRWWFPRESLRGYCRWYLMHCWQYLRILRMSSVARYAMSVRGPGSLSGSLPTQYRLPTTTRRYAPRSRIGESAKRSRARSRSFDS